MAVSVSCEDTASYHTALDIQSSHQSLDKRFVWMELHPETQDISKSFATGLSNDSADVSIWAVLASRELSNVAKVEVSQYNLSSVKWQLREFPPGLFAKW